LGWTIKYREEALKALKKLDKQWQRKIISELEEIACLSHPRMKGKALKHSLKHFWRYRVENYRIICQIIDKELCVLVVNVDHRKKVYK
jgi:mRNA interferase RelE/StbE